MTRLPASLAACAALLVSSVAVASNWSHPDFDSGVSRPRRIALLPVTSDMVRSKINDAEPMVKETVALENALRAAAEVELQRLGYQPDLVSLNSEAIKSDRELTRLVNDFLGRLGEVMPNVASSPRGVRQGRYTVGDPALVLGARVEADGLMLVESQTVIPSKGQRTMSGVLNVLFGGLPIPPRTVSQVVVTLVDARTGNIASVTVAQEAGAALKRPEIVAHGLIRDAFAPFPGVDTAVVAKKRKTKRGRQQVPPAPTDVVPVTGASRSEEDVLADFEKADAALPETPAAPDEPPPISLDAPRDFLPEGVEPTAEPVRIPAIEGGEPREAASEPSRVEPPRNMPVAVPAADPQAPDREAIRLQSVPADQRPAATHQLVLQMLDGGPAILVKNMSEPAVRVSIDLGPWTELEAGADFQRQLAPGSHRILVTDTSGQEVARGSVILGADALARAEIWPR